MLQQVVLMTPDPVTLDIDSVNPDDIVIVKSISGLDPAPLTLFTGDYSRDGGYYQGRRLGGRNPVFNLKINPDYVNDVEVSDIREMLYEWFLEPTPGEDGLQVVLKDDRKPDRYFIGYTENIPSDIFSRDTSAQVSMLSVDGYLRSLDEETDSDATGWVSHTIPYEGSAKTGLEMLLEVKTATTEINININGTIMELNGTFAVGDDIYVNTLVGARAIRQNGSDIMASLVSGPEWVQLRKGDNAFQTHGSVVSDGKVALMEYTFRAAWWGI